MSCVLAYGFGDSNDRGLVLCRVLGLFCKCYAVRLIALRFRVFYSVFGLTIYRHALPVVLVHFHRDGRGFLCVGYLFQPVSLSGFR